MKIISKFTDYYDHLSYVYGVDSSILYVRNPLSDEVIHKGYNCPNIEELFWYMRMCHGDIVGVVIIDTIYWCIQNKFPEEKGLTFVTEEKRIEINKKLRRSYTIQQTKYKSNDVLSLTKEVGQPVYQINRFGSMVLEERIPILSTINNLPGAYPANQIYQDLSYALANTMRDSPDILPPVQTSNDDRIVSPGFDLKQSFRHRK